jgi:hypothetical protein
MQLEMVESLLTNKKSPDCILINPTMFLFGHIYLDLFISIKYTENGFETQIENALRKRGIPID